VLVVPLFIVCFLWAAVCPGGDTSATKINFCRPVFSASAEEALSRRNDRPTHFPPHFQEMKDLVTSLYPNAAYLAKGGQSYVYLVPASESGGPERVVLVPSVPGAERMLQTYKEQERHSKMIPDTGRVARVRSVYEKDGVPILEMDFIPGQTLARHLKDHGTPSPATTVSLMKQIAQGAADMHSARVVHGDIKPLNVMLSQLASSSHPTATLLDLGLAAEVGQFPVAAGRREDGTAEVTGTVAFLPAEKVLDRLPADTKDDREAISRTYERVLFPDAAKDLDTRVVNLVSTTSVTDVNPFFGMSPYSIYRAKGKETPPNYDIVSALAYHYPWTSTESFIRAHQKAEEAMEGKGNFFKDYYGPVLLKEMAEADPARARATIDTSLELKERYDRGELGLDAATAKKIREVPAQD